MLPPEDVSIWQAANVDKNAFYNKAKRVSERPPSRQPHPTSNTIPPNTSKERRDFLDRLADCFARSKSDIGHVCATAMVVDSRLKTVKIYIAKNRGYKHGLDAFTKADRKFAQKLFSWFGKIAINFMNNADLFNHKDPSLPAGPMWDDMISFYRTRLEYYVAQLNELLDSDVLNIYRTISGQSGHAIRYSQEILDFCEALDEGPDCAKCAILAWRCRHSENVESFRKALNIAYEDYRTDQDRREDEGYLRVRRFLHLSDCFEKLPSIYCHLVHHCRNGLKGLRFESRLLSGYRTNSPLGQDTARYYHCEMQLLHHFLQYPEEEQQREKYFGCSKLSCCLCWQTLSLVDDFSTKGSHMQIYDKWMLPYEHDKPYSGLLISVLQEVSSRLHQIPDPPSYVERRPSFVFAPQTSARLSGNREGMYRCRKQSTICEPNHHMTYKTLG